MSMSATEKRIQISMVEHNLKAHLTIIDNITEEMEKMKRRKTVLLFEAKDMRAKIEKIKRS